ncbi:MAG: hypothetical protein H6828_14585 [Planctomycetes bacterium]|nr:hypothetical protein [Planctomycetota bacterium]
MRCTPLPLVGLLALAPLAAAQGDTPTPARDGGWHLVDRVELVVNTDCLTLKALDRKVNASPEMTATPTSDAQLDQLRTKIALEEVDERLRRQAGEDLGFEEALVKARANEMLQTELDESGGLFQASRQLSTDGETVVERREEKEGELYSMSWRASVTGYDAGPGGRPVYDRFARPGQLRQRYKRMRSTGLELQAVLARQGAKEATYSIEVLAIDPRQTGGFEGAHERAVLLRQELLAGQRDWQETLDEYGALDNPGGADIGRRDLLSIWDPGDGSLAAFCESAQPGDLSPVLLFAPSDVRGQRPARALQIVRFEGRTDPVLPSFDAPGVQRSLTYYLQNLGDTKREDLALDELRRRAYIWYPGIDQVRSQRAAEAEQREREAREQREAAEARRSAPGESKPADDAAVQPDAPSDGR